MQRWEPVALLQPWQHCPPHTLTLREQQTRTSVRQGTPAPHPEPGRGAGAGPGDKGGKIEPSRLNSTPHAGPGRPRNPGIRELAPRPAPRAAGAPGRRARGRAGNTAVSRSPGQPPALSPLPRGRQRPRRGCWRWSGAGVWSGGRAGREGALPRQRRQLVLLAEGQGGAAVAVGPWRRLEPRAEAGRLGEGGGVSGGVGVDLAGGAQAELDGGAARLAHPPGPLRGAAAAAVARVQLHIERALLLLLLPPEEGRALLPAARGAPPAGLQDVRDPP